jgi:hypothetical protein
MGLHQTKKFCTAEETIIIMKRQHTEWEKTIASFSLSKGLICRIYKDLKKLNSKITNNPVNKWTNE